MRPVQEAPQGTTAELTRTAPTAARSGQPPRVRHPVAWSLTALLGGLWLIGTLGSERIEPSLRELVSQFEVWRGLDVARGPLDVNFEDTSPKTDDDASAKKNDNASAKVKPDASKAEPSVKKKPLPKRKPAP